MPHTSSAVDDYLANLPEDRREALSRVRNAIVKNLPQGYEEVMEFDMPAYVIPLSRYPKTYNGHPLMYAAFASQKNHMAIYLMSLYANNDIESWFRDAFAKAGKKLDMGKSCIRFKKLDDLPLEVIEQAITKVSVDTYIAYSESSRRTAQN